MATRKTVRAAGLRAKGAKDGSSHGQPEPAPAKKLTPRQCRTHMRRRLAEAFPQIVEGFVKQAQAGSCPHVKLVGELLQTPDPRRGRKKSSAEMVLEEWKRTFPERDARMSPR